MVNKLYAQWATHGCSQIWTLHNNTHTFISFLTLCSHLRGERGANKIVLQTFSLWTSFDLPPGFGTMTVLRLSHNSCPKLSITRIKGYITRKMVQTEVLPKNNLFQSIFVCPLACCAVPSQVHLQAFCAPYLFHSLKIRFKNYKSAYFSSFLHGRKRMPFIL